MNHMVEEFAASLRRFDAGTIERAAKVIRVTGDELGTLRATLAIARALRSHSRSVEAAAAGRRAAAAVTGAALAAGLSEDDPDVAVVRRRAAEVARGLVVVGSVLPHLAVLLRDWGQDVSFHSPDQTTPSAPVVAASAVDCARPA